MKWGIAVVVVGIGLAMLVLQREPAPDSAPTSDTARLPARADRVVALIAEPVRAAIAPPPSMAETPLVAHVDRPTAEYVAGDALRLSIRSSTDTGLAVIAIDADGYVGLFGSGRPDDVAAPAHRDVTYPKAPSEFMGTYRFPVGPSFLLLVGNDRDIPVIEPERLRALQSPLKHPDDTWRDIAALITQRIRAHPEAHWVSVLVPFTITAPMAIE